MKFNLKDCKLIYNNKEIKPKLIDFESNLIITNDFEKIPLDKVYILDYFKYGFEKFYHKDILKVTFKSHFMGFNKGEIITGILEYFDNEWIFKTKNNNFELKKSLYCIESIERLGNYFTNPELLI
jgi:hypothetical protein